MHDKLDELIYQIKYGDIPIELIDCIYYNLEIDKLGINKSELAMRIKDGLSEFKGKPLLSIPKIENLPTNIPLVYNRHNWNYHAPREILIESTSYYCKSFIDLLVSVIGYIIIVYNKSQTDINKVINRYGIKIVKDNSKLSLEVDEIQIPINGTEYIINIHNKNSLDNNQIINIVQSLAHIVNIQDTSIYILLAY